VSVRAVAPARLRRRLAVAFLLVGGISTGALALGSYLIVRNARLADSADRAVSQSRFNLQFAATTELSVPELLDALDTRGAFCTVVLKPGAGPAQSCLDVTPRQIPADLRELVAAGQLARRRVTLAGTNQLVVGGRVPAQDEELYFFYDEQQVFDDLRTLGIVLAGGWLVLTMVAGSVGLLLARRTLAPVADASRAARSLAEGLLDTRLPVAGHDEFSAWAASFNEMAEALEAKIAALSEAQARERRFTANVAHELRTPLTALVNEAQLLAESAEQMPPEARRLAGMLVTDVGRLRRLTEDLLEISRLDAGGERTETSMVNVGTAVASMLRQHGWSDRAVLDAADVVLQTDRRRLERIVANLVGNAVTHGREGVRVRISRDGAWAVIDVSDRGRGLDPEFLPRAFDRFSKADRSRSGGGTGLGLAIARENARLLGGDVTVRSRPGEGAVFTLRLPVSEPLRDGEAAVADNADDGDTLTLQRGEPR
jgi:two-component system, OmpR family, sensor histidine kinase MtrB